MLPLPDIIVKDQHITNTTGSTAIDPIDVDNLLLTTSTIPLTSTIPSTLTIPSTSTIQSTSTIPSTSTIQSTSTTDFSNSILTNTPVNSHNTSISRIYNNSTPTSNSTIRSDQSILSMELTDIDDFIQEIAINLQLEYKVSGMAVIIINNTINVVKEIWEWIENANNNDLLKKPMISVITER